VCLDVTRDVTAMRTQGKTLLEVRRAIDAKYHGTPTPTPDPKADGATSPDAHRARQKSER